ncbi:MAG: hypothetical protein ACK5OC_12550 [Pirellula sp.]|jgi:hypothetical protein
MKNILDGPGDIDDEGRGYICIRFPNQESLNLIHADEAQAKVKALLPKLDVKFVK